MKKIVLLTTVLLCCLQFSYAQHAGDLDPSFGTEGIVRTSIGSRFDVPATGKQVLLQPDGSIYVLIEVNDVSFIEKMHSDGLSDDTSICIV